MKITVDPKLSRKATDLTKVKQLSLNSEQDLKHTLIVAPILATPIFNGKKPHFFSYARCRLKHVPRVWPKYSRTATRNQFHMLQQSGQ